MPASATAPTLDELLASVESIDRITIDLENGRFVWRLHSAGRQVASVSGRQADVPSMIRSTAALVNCELGIADDSSCDPSLN